MVCARAIAVPRAEVRPLGGWTAFGMSVAVAILGVRALETSGDPVAFGRILVSAIALAAFFLARRHSLAKGLLLALAIETTAGVALFTFVDLPFLRAHAPQIGRRAAMLLIDWQRSQALSVRPPATPT